MKKRILIVDDSPSARSLFKDIFKNEKDIEIIFAETGEQAVELVNCITDHNDSQKIDFILMDINLPGIDGFTALELIKKKNPLVRSCFMTSYDIDKYISISRIKGITNIISKHDSAQDILKTIKNLLTGKGIFGLENYLEHPFVIENYSIYDLNSFTKIINKIVLDFEDIIDQQKQFRLKTSIVEIGLNAIYHAYGYKKGSNVKLKQNQYIIIQSGKDNEKIAIAIRDGGGTLTKDIVLEYLYKGIHPTEETLDSSEGRGLFLSRVLCDRFLINIETGKRTEIILMIYLQENFKSLKPLLIYQI